MEFGLTLIFILGITAYASAVWQMLANQYSPSFFSRGIWFLLGINSFAGVLLGNGSSSAVALATTLLIGNGAVFITSYWKGSRNFGLVEKISLLLLIVSLAIWAVFEEPYLGLILSLVAHFIGGIPTIWRAYKRPESEHAYHWYFFFVAAVISILTTQDKTMEAILLPLYFALFDGLIIFLDNRKKVLRHRRKNKTQRKRQKKRR